MANNFIEENKTQEIKKNISVLGNGKEEIKWTEPLSENKDDNISELNKQKPGIQNNNSNQNFSDVKKEKKSFLNNFFSKFHKKEEKSFKEDKKILAQKSLELKKEQDDKLNVKENDKKRKDIAEVVKEKLKENKIKIDDGQILKTNLMDGGPTILVDWKRIFLFFILALFIVVLAIGFLYAFLLFKERKENIKGDELSQEIQMLNRRIKKEKEGLKEIDRFQSKLLIAKDILDKHIYWTNFFKFLEENTLNNIYYAGGISGNAEGSYSFKAISDSYKNITEQLKVLNNSDLVKEVKVNSGSMEDKKSKEGKTEKKQVTFNLELILKPEIFYK